MAALNSAFRKAGTIEQTIRNYVEGWYDRDTARIQEAMHPLLAKQGIIPDEAGGVRSIDLATLLEVTPIYGGDASGERTLEMKILATDGDIASAMVTSNEYVDYMHLVWSDGRWQILNVLWEFRSAETDAHTSQCAQELEKAMRDYIEGWYDKDSARIAECLHPNLAKRNLNPETPGGVDQYTRSSMLDMVKQYGGPGGPGRIFDMTVLDVKNRIASVRLVSNVFVDYVHLAHTNGQWKILNVLWTWK